MITKRNQIERRSIVTIWDLFYGYQKDYIDFSLRNYLSSRLRHDLSKLVDIQLIQPLENWLGKEFYD